MLPFPRRSADEPAEQVIKGLVKRTVSGSLQHAAPPRHDPSAGGLQLRHRRIEQLRVPGLVRHEGAEPFNPFPEHPGVLPGPVGEGAEGAGIDALLPAVADGPEARVATPAGNDADVPAFAAEGIVDVLDEVVFAPD